MVVILDLRAFKNLKAHTGEHIDHLIFHQCQRMKVSHRAHLYRYSHINCFLFIFLLQFKSLDLRTLFLVLTLDPGLYFIHKLPVSFLFFFGNLFDPVHQPLDGSRLAKVLLPDLRKLDLRLSRLNVIQKSFF